MSAFGQTWKLGIFETFYSREAVEEQHPGLVVVEGIEVREDAHLEHLQRQLGIVPAGRRSSKVASGWGIPHPRLTDGFSLVNEERRKKNSGGTPSKQESHPPLAVLRDLHWLVVVRVLRVVELLQVKKKETRRKKCRIMVQCQKT